jgi:putative protease
MKVVSYIDHISEFDKFIGNVDELILAPSILSRQGTLNTNDLVSLAKLCKENKIRPVLEWDILMTNEAFNQCADYVKSLDLNLFEAIRVQDPGALNWVLDNLEKMPIQLVLEQGSHNYLAVKTWVDHIGDRIDRLILSLELPKNILKSYIEKLNCPVEFLGLGRILLFYTPRPLVSSTLSNEKVETLRIHNRPIEISGSSEESPHKGFPLLENKHGTFMFNTKDHCLLENIPELEEIGLTHIRYDIRWKKDSSLIEKLFKLTNGFQEELVTEIKELYGATVIRGFFKINKSDVIFKKLKNNRIQRTDSNYLGEVVEVNKKKHIGILVRSKNLSISLGDKIKMITPEGKEKSLELKDLRNSSMVSIDKGQKDQIVFVPHISGISVKTAVYIN